MFQEKTDGEGDLGHHALEQSDCSCLKLCWTECREGAHRRAMENLWISQNPTICLLCCAGQVCALPGQTGPSGGAQHLCREWMWSPWRAALGGEELVLGCLELLSHLSATKPEQGDDVWPCWGCRDLLSSTWLPSQRAQLEDFNWDTHWETVCSACRWPIHSQIQRRRPRLVLPWDSGHGQSSMARAGSAQSLKDQSLAPS